MPPTDEATGSSGEGGASTRAELLRALAVLVEPPGPEAERLAPLMELPSVPDGRAYTEAFLFQLPPYASVYVGPEGMMGGEARARVAGFWTALGYTPPGEPDHLAALLGLYALLQERERAATGAERALAGTAHAALLHEHLSPWIFGYLDRVREVAAGAYGAWATILTRVLREAAELAPPPAELPLHLRDAPVLADPRTDGGEGFLAGVLAPVRTGTIVTRHALANHARALGLGLRVGERSYVLDHLLAQDPVAVLDRLAGEARRQAVEHTRRGVFLGPAADFLAGRAERTAALLAELAQDGARALEAASAESRA